MSEKAKDSTLRECTEANNRPGLKGFHFSLKYGTHLPNKAYPFIKRAKKKKIWET